MKAIPSYFYVIFIGAFLTMILVIYFVFDTKQNEQTHFLNETVATFIPQYVDLGMARVHEYVFIEKSAFETDIQNEVIKNYPDASVQFDYLEHSSGALKAVKVTMNIVGEMFTTTYKVSEI